jgi:hypothetical protein
VRETVSEARDAPILAGIAMLGALLVCLGIGRRWLAVRRLKRLFEASATDEEEALTASFVEDDVDGARDYQHDVGTLKRARRGTDRASMADIELLDALELSPRRGHYRREPRGRGEDFVGRRESTLRHTVATPADEGDNFQGGQAGHEQHEPPRRPGRAIAEPASNSDGKARNAGLRSEVESEHGLRGRSTGTALCARETEVASSSARDRACIPPPPRSGLYSGSSGRAGRASEPVADRECRFSLADDALRGQRTRKARGMPRSGRARGGKDYM